MPVIPWPPAIPTFQPGQRTRMRFGPQDYRLVTVTTTDGWLVTVRGPDGLPYTLTADDLAG
jgi:hypothetical protein